MSEIQSISEVLEALEVCAAGAKANQAIKVEEVLGKWETVLLLHDAGPENLKSFFAEVREAIGVSVA